MIMSNVEKCGLQSAKCRGWIPGTSDRADAVTDRVPGGVEPTT